MKVFIKDLSADIELKNNGVELEVRNPKGEFLGDLVVTKSQLIWCKGKVKRENGKSISWKDFMAYMEGRE